MSIHIIVIVITCAISIIAFGSRNLMYKSQLNAYDVVKRRQYFRLFSYGFVHGDWMHLLINMFVLWSFGNALIYYYDVIFNGNGSLYFLLLYITAIPISALYSVHKYKNDPNYNAVGASGAVSAIVYAAIFLNPYSLLRFWGIPVPGIVFGIIYLVYSGIMAKRKIDNIGHDAHFWGAVYGFLFSGLLNPSLFGEFFRKLFFME